MCNSGYTPTYHKCANGLLHVEQYCGAGRSPSQNGTWDDLAFRLDADGILRSNLDGSFGLCASVTADGWVTMNSCDISPPGSAPAPARWYHDIHTGQLRTTIGIDIVCLDWAERTLVPPNVTNVWARRLADGDSGHAVVFINVGLGSADIECSASCFEAMGYARGQKLLAHDVWAGTDLPPITSSAFVAEAVPADGGVRVLRVHPSNAGVQSAYTGCVVNGVATASCFGDFNASDSTEMLQAALSSNVSTLIIDQSPGGGPWIVRPLFATSSNQTIVFCPGVHLLAKTDEYHGLDDALLAITDVHNLTVHGNGAVLQMRRDDYAYPPRGTCPSCRPYSKAEWRMGIWITNCSSIGLYNLTVLESGGDGIYINGLPGSRDIRISDCVFDRHYRQGMSIIGVSNMLVERTRFSNTNGIAIL